MAAIGPYGDIAGALGSTVTALALAGPQMLTWIKATKVATIAQKAFNVVMRLNPIGLIVTANHACRARSLYVARPDFWLPKGSVEWSHIWTRDRLQPYRQDRARAKGSVGCVKFQFEPAMQDAEVAIAEVSASLDGGSSGRSLVPSLLAAQSAVEDLSQTIEWQSAQLGYWGLDISKMGKLVEPIPPFMSDADGDDRRSVGRAGSLGLEARSGGGGPLRWAGRA